MQDLARPRCPTRAALLLLVATSSTGGCASTVSAPGAPDDPVATYLLLDAKHPGLALPDPGGGYVEYAFGEWGWFAWNRNRWYHGFGAMLWPTQATLGRRILLARDGAELRQRFHWMEIHELIVERSAADRLRVGLERISEQDRRSRHHNELYGMTFVPLERAYWFGHNCNDEVADWLAELGCSVSWVPIRRDLEPE